jgi:hypothetical protein
MPRKRNTPSSIDRLPHEVQELIGQLRRSGRTIEEIRAKLMELDVEVARSTLGRHVKKMADVQRRMRDSRDMAQALVSQFGAEPDNKLAQANIDLMHSIIMQTLAHVEEDENGNPKPIIFDPKDAMFLSSSLSNLASAAKNNDARIIKAKEIGRKEEQAAARKKLEAAGRAGDIDPEALVKAKRIMGYE